MSREEPNRPPLNRPVEVVSGGSERRSSESTICCGSGLGEKGPEARNAAPATIASRTRVPMVARKPTMKRRMRSSPERTNCED
jgi:hypothetical protein